MVHVKWKKNKRDSNESEDENEQLESRCESDEEVERTWKIINGN